MADPKDLESKKLCRREFVRHRIDVTQCEIRVSHGIVSLRGVIRAVKGANYANLEEETLRISRLLRQKPFIRDVVVEVAYR